PLAAPLVDVAEPGQPVVAHPGIGDDGRPRLDMAGDERVQRGGGPISQQRHAAPADPLRLLDFYRDGGEDLLARRPAAPLPRRHGSSPPPPPCRPPGPARGPPPPSAAGAAWPTPRGRGRSPAPAAGSAPRPRPWPWRTSSRG